MLPVLSSPQIRRLEAITMDLGGDSTLDLMERAGSACALRIQELLKEGAFGSADRFLVIAGMGNNGGDGLVIARHLRLAGFPVRVLRVLHRKDPSPENQANSLLLPNIGVEIADIDHSILILDPAHNEIIIDCLFGTGLTRPVEGWVKDLVGRMNASGRPIISVDVPSGLLPPEEGTAFDSTACVRADHTLTFEVPRLSLLLPETGEFAGRFDLVPIGLNQTALEKTERLGGWVRCEDVRKILSPKPRFAHKGTFGHALVSAGSKGLYGAAILATKGCLRSGVGLVTAHLPLEAAPALLVAAPDAMSFVDQGVDHLSILPAMAGVTAMGIGPGIGQHRDVVALVQLCLTEVPAPLVLDADALNILAAHPAWFNHLETRVVLTPHPKEMDRLLGITSVSSYDRLGRARDFAARHRCTVVLKGAYTVTCTSDGRAFFNSTGNVGLAKGGSGDVLTGLLAGLLAQGYSTLDACLLGVYLHGSAGDMAADELGMDAMRPSDLINALPIAWKKLRSSSEEAFQ